MEELAPGEAVYYTWAEPTGSRILTWKWGKYKGELKSEEVRNKNQIWWLTIQHLIVINCIHLKSITNLALHWRLCNLTARLGPCFICSIGPSCWMWTRRGNCLSSHFMKASSAWRFSPPSCVSSRRFAIMRKWSWLSRKPASRYRTWAFHWSTTPPARKWPSLASPGTAGVMVAYAWHKQVLSTF